MSNFIFFFFNDTATTEIYTLSLHDALPISEGRPAGAGRRQARHPRPAADGRRRPRAHGDRKSTRLNSSHDQISYAVFCLKKKKQQTTTAAQFAHHLINSPPPPISSTPYSRA